MRTKTWVLAIVLCSSAAVAGQAADPNVGSWTLNEAKSTFAPGMPKNITVVYTVVDDGYKCVVDGVDGAGKPAHNEWIGKFDGNDYAVTGDPSADTRSLKMVKTGHYVLANKKGGKTVATGTVDFSEDGKTRTLTVQATDAAGNKITSTAVYERQ
jgi:hypothetical protein